MLHFNKIKVGQKFYHKNIYGQQIPCEVSEKSKTRLSGSRCFQVRVDYTDDKYIRNTNEAAAIILSDDGFYDGRLIPC